MINLAVFITMLFLFSCFFQKKAAGLVVLIPFLSACATTRLAGTKEGNLIESHKNFKQALGSFGYKISFERDDSTKNSKLVVKVKKIQSINEQWEDTYSKVNVYETQCKGYRSGEKPSFMKGLPDVNYCDFDGGKFFVSHFLIYGFLYDLALPFLPYNDEVLSVDEPTDGTVTKQGSNAVTKEMPLQENSIQVTVNRVAITAVLLDGIARIDFKSLGIKTFDLLPENAHVSLKIGGKEIDESFEFAEFQKSEKMKISQRLASEEERAVESAPFAHDLTEKQEKELNKFKDREPLVYPLMKSPSGQNQFKKETIYLMKNFKIIQKVKGGYLITVNIADSPNLANIMEFGVACLKTKKSLPEDLLISGTVYYSGQYKYTTINGFEKDIPLLQIPAELPISGIHPNGNPFSPEYY